MKKIRWLQVMSNIGIAILITNSAVMAGDEAKDINQQRMACAKRDVPASKPDPNEKSIYIPPKRGSPKGRVAGGTRGPQEFPRLIALAPDHTGLTVHEQPALYWVLSSSTKHPVKLTIINTDTSKVVIEKYLPPTRRAGIQVIRLEQYDIRLEVGVPYRWLVTLESESHGGYVFAGGVVEQAPVAPSLSVKLRQACPFDLPAIYLAEGVWYDALATLFDLIEGTPQDLALRKYYVALLEQAGLTEAASYDEIHSIEK